MRRNNLLLLIALCCLLGLDSAQPTELLHFKNYGFSIAPLDAEANGASYAVLAMTLPPSDGFAPNVNVIVQAYNGTVDDYISLSKRGFAAKNLKLLSASKPEKNTALFEYSGLMGGMELHWYAKAVLNSGRAYLATATTTIGLWDSQAAKLKACVNSLELDQLQDAGHGK